MVKAIKVQVKITDKKHEKEIIKAIQDVQYEEYRALNKCINFLHKEKMEELGYLNRGEKWPDQRERYEGKLLRNYLYDIIKPDFSPVGQSNIMCVVVMKAMSRFQTDCKNGLLKGNISLSTYKRNVPVYFSNAGVTIESRNGKFYARLQLIAPAKAKKDIGLKNGTIEVCIEKPDGNKKAVLQRIVGGIYKMGECNLAKDRRGHWMLSIAYSFEAQKTEGYNVLGIDIGIHNIMALAVYDPTISDYTRLSFRECLIGRDAIDSFDKQMKSRRRKALYDGGYIEDVRDKYQRKRRAYGIASKLSDGGKGYKKRNRKLLYLRNAEKNFRDTKNHQYSRYAVDFAVKHGCNLIQMEDLSGNSFADDKFLKNWPYYDLQQKITYKAKEKGIEVQLIKPQYTSKRCSWCGYINMDIKDTTVREWTCPICGKSHNRDYNAAKNIAMLDIESIIQAELERQKNLEAV